LFRIVEWESGDKVKRRVGRLREKWNDQIRNDVEDRGGKWKEVEVRILWEDRSGCRSWWEEV
jgi:hypothetical protein